MPGWVVKTAQKCWTWKTPWPIKFGRSLCIDRPIMARGSPKQEPYRLWEWHPKAIRAASGRLFTCARPGRGIFSTKKVAIGPETIGLWVDGLPTARPLHLISLLGQKPDGYSEFGFYPFRSRHEVGDKPTFQEWMDQRYIGRFAIYEFPTIDTLKIPEDIFEAIKHLVAGLLADHRTVMIVDSGGYSRSGKVCERMEYATNSR
jgi:hypothetical protein